jgi:pteridine reductase
VQSPATKVALVTGSGRRRVGNVVVEALARRGFDVVVHYRTAAAEAQQTALELRGLGVRALALGAELTQEEAVRDLVGETRRQMGRLDVLVNCAGAWSAQRFEDVTASEVRRYFESNVLATFLCCQQAGLAMVAQPEGGCIVNLGDWAIERPYANYAAYFASKGAVPALTRSLAVELGTRNPKVRVNCIHPGPVLFPADLPAEERAEAVRGTLLQREGRPENIAQGVLFLIDNDFVTGACITIDGGRSVYAPDSA